MSGRVDPIDESAVAAQLGRSPRGIHEVAHRCPCGNPDVVTTVPRLPDGTPFPTTYYLTCPRAASMIGRGCWSGADGTAESTVMFVEESRYSSFM